MMYNTHAAIVPLSANNALLYNNATTFAPAAIAAIATAAAAALLLLFLFVGSVDTFLQVCTQFRAHSRTHTHTHASCMWVQK